MFFTSLKADIHINLYYITWQIKKRSQSLNKSQILKKESLVLERVQSNKIIKFYTRRSCSATVTFSKFQGEVRSYAILQLVILIILTLTKSSSLYATQSSIHRNVFTKGSISLELPSGTQRLHLMLTYLKTSYMTPVLRNCWYDYNIILNLPELTNNRKINKIRNSTKAVGITEIPEPIYLITPVGPEGMLA